MCTPEQNKDLTFVFHLNLYQQVNRNSCMNKKETDINGQCTENENAIRRVNENAHRMDDTNIIHTFISHLHPQRVIAWLHFYKIVSFFFQSQLLAQRWASTIKLETCQRNCSPTIWFELDFIHSSWRDFENAWLFYIDGPFLFKAGKDKGLAVDNK